MPFSRCISPSCGRPFQLNQFQFSAEVCVPWKRGEVMCPHCGTVMAGEASSVFLTHALSPAQETEFNARDTIGSSQSDGQDGRLTQV
jgi:hypothetical protein